MRPSRVLFPLLVAFALTVAACGRDGGSDHPPQPGDRAVARVLDETIWASDVKREAVAQGLVGEGEPLDVSSALFRRVLDEVIDQKLLAREAERRGLDNSPLAQRRLAAARGRILGGMVGGTGVDGKISLDEEAELLRRQEAELEENRRQREEAERREREAAQEAARKAAEEAARAAEEAETDGEA